MHFPAKVELKADPAQGAISGEALTRQVTVWYLAPDNGPDPAGYCVVAPAATQAAITARSSSDIFVMFPRGIIRVTTTC